MRHSMSMFQEISLFDMIPSQGRIGLTIRLTLIIKKKRHIHVENVNVVIVRQ